VLSTPAAENACSVSTHIGGMDNRYGCSKQRLRLPPVVKTSIYALITLQSALSITVGGSAALLLEAPPA